MIDRLWELLLDSESVAGRAVTSAAVVAVAWVTAWVLGRLLARRAGDRFERYYARKIGHYVAVVLAVIALSVVWRPFAGRIGVVVGFATAGVAFAMQEVIGAIAGWFNIVWGRVFRVGDRIEMGGVRGDVIDISPLRTKVMEIGTGTDERAWVQGRQYTGRIVAISNKASFTEPVYNFSAAWDYLWEEVRVPIAYDDDWHVARDLLQEEATSVAAGSPAEDAMEAMAQRYPVPRTELEPRVYVRATDDYLELAVRFPVPVRTARAVKDELTRRVLERLEQAGIKVASATQDITVRSR